MDKKELLQIIENAAKKELTELDLRNNQLRELPPEIGQLTSLTELDLRNNQLSELPPEIGQLTSLAELSLNNNQLRVLPPEITQLNNLIWLYLYGNKLRELPPEITQLNNLRRLGLGDNQLRALPPKIGKMTNLTSLNLEGNQLHELPPEIGQLNNRTKLYLSFNPLEAPPLEIANQGIEAIAQYFEQLAKEGMDYLYEAKLLIVGEPGAGKTTLTRKIKNPNAPMPGKDETTRGVDIETWRFPQLDKPDFRVNIWDFGGQAIYHATHRFFLTRRSLYVLVADTRKDDTDFFYWLNIIEVLSEDSPVLIIKNETDDRLRKLAEKQLRGLGYLE